MACGGLFTNALLRETGTEITGELMDRLPQLHAEAHARRSCEIRPLSTRPLPGARELLMFLANAGIPWAIATNGRMSTAQRTLDVVGIDPRRIPVITRDQVQHAKPDPGLFLAAAHRLNMNIVEAMVVGDSIWDLLAARRALGIGLLSGGYGAHELERAGAYRVYDDPEGLLKHLDEVGLRRA